MPLMKPARSERNFIPTSIGFWSEMDATDGAVVSGNLVHGQALPGGVSRLRLSSTARLRTCAAPLDPGVKVYDQLERPVASCQRWPPSTETSTPPTTPPPVSVAV